jgi:hypothetical protein
MNMIDCPMNPPGKYYNLLHSSEIMAASRGGGGRWSKQVDISKRVLRKVSVLRGLPNNIEARSSYVTLFFIIPQ